MNLDFKPITLDRQRDYLEILSRHPWEASDYSFTNMWGWHGEYDLEWAWADGMVWIRQNSPIPVLWAPVGPWDRIDWADSFDRLFPEKTEFIRVPEKLALQWETVLSGRIILEEIREHWDYLYDVSELIELKGNRFHKKKNLLNQFVSKYNHQYVPLSPAVIQQALCMQEDWCVWRDCESAETLAAENRAICRVLNQWDHLENLSGGAVMVEGRMAAFTVAEKMNPETVLIHFEKGLAEYKGVYQAINHMFLSQTQGYKQVNREQDLGDEGLRKAKLSYNPLGYVKKYRATVG
jgi:hypothetical protein